MAENSGISWTHNTFNFWRGCRKIAPECEKCYITRPVQGRLIAEWGKVERSANWSEPFTWEQKCTATGEAKRIFTCSYSDFFIREADLWRPLAWDVIKHTPHLAWLILTKRHERIATHLPDDWGEGYKNVWLGVSTGCKQTLNKMDTLRKIPAAVRFVSCEPLLEDISKDINLDGFGWVIVGGESGSGTEYLWDAAADWKAELKNGEGRRTMRYGWAAALRDKTTAAGLPFFFKQTSAPRPGYGANALDGQLWHEFPAAPSGYKWAVK